MKNINLDELQNSLFGLLEGATDPEYSLYQSMFDAICLYKKGEGYYGIYKHDDRNTYEASCNHIEFSDVDYYEHELECGHTMITTDKETPKYCSECGRKIWIF